MSTPGARRILVEGVVQGVGFRPFVFALARRRGLAGWVRNTTAGVEIEVEGSAEAVDAFLGELRAQLPPLAQIDRVSARATPARGRADFAIERSLGGDGSQPVSPDVATCAECLAEVMDPRDRRAGYPFTNCTACGPRFTIVRELPYDRARTTMAGFTMCARCRAEYENPRHRRFHAEPNACPQCGPRLRLVDASGVPRPGEPVAETRRLLAAGGIVAIKGIGGFHLACDAADDAAVRRLREGKRRPAKPLAVMVADVAEAERLCVVSPRERELLASAARPIVLLHARPASGIAPTVAPGTVWLGVMLPYAPLHYLLFFDPGRPAVGPDGAGERPLGPLVMTSGNLSEEPIATDNAAALAGLVSIADAFLLHDRPIHARCDDSVTRLGAGAELPLRRARGHAPLRVRLPFAAPPTLALGAELKSTVCLAQGRQAFVSPHLGDLASPAAFAAYAETVDRMARLFRIRPEVVAHDLHPDYLSTRYAETLDTTLARVGVQHHHAHLAACMAEHRLRGSLIGVAFDGAGYGTDGTVWGGEFLVADYAGFERVAHLGSVPMPGGDRAAREPFRMALAHLLHAVGEWDPRWPAVAHATEAEGRAVRWQIAHGVNAPLTSSVGRLFDAVASLIGVCHRARHEGEAAMALEALAEGGEGASYPLAIASGPPLVVEPGAVIRGVVADLAAGATAPAIAARFHATLAEAVAEVCRRVRAATGLGRVVLSGGVFQNATLLAATRRRLAAAGFDVYSHHVVPPNDGGIALGQAAVAQARLKAT